VQEETVCTAEFRLDLCQIGVIHVIPAIPAGPVRPESGRSAKDRAYEATRLG